MSDRQVLYKSRSGTHQSHSHSRNRLAEVNKKKRTEGRQAAHAAHRHIEPTPQKPLTAKPALIPKPVTKSDSTGSSASSTNNTKQSDLSRQQAFKQRFKEYCEKKAQEKQKKKPTPFVSSVPAGRFLNGNKGAAVTKPIDNKVAKLTNKVATETKWSPINTRSRKLKLLSPSQLPTPKRKRKKSVNTAATTPLSAAASILPSKSKTPVPLIKLNANLNKNTSVKKVLKSSAANAKPVKEPAKKFEVPQKSKPKPKSKPVSALIITKPPVIPERFQFQPAALNTIATSTVVKGKKSTAGNASIKNNSKKLFNESISPIENSSPKPLRSSPLVSVAAAVQADPPNQKSAEPEDLNTTPLNTTDRLNESANYVSPFVTIRRGARGSHRKEKEARESKYLLNSRKTLNNSLEDRQHKEAAQYFRLQMKRETDRLMALVDEWSLYKDTYVNNAANEDLNTNNITIPSEYIDLIDVAIGQTRLLTTNKFQQFRVLVEQCEQCIAVQPVRPEDLEGFWNMMYIQVENCDKRFERLRVLKENSWEDPDLPVTKQKKLNPNSGVIKKKPKQKATKPNTVLSQMLAQARKKFMDDNRKKSEANTNDAEESTSNGENGIIQEKNNKNLPLIQLNRSQRRSTPRKSLWVVEKNGDTQTTDTAPRKSILKTPGSMRKARNVLFAANIAVSKSPLFRTKEKENSLD